MTPPSVWRLPCFVQLAPVFTSRPLSLTSPHSVCPPRASQPFRSRLHIYQPTAQLSDAPSGAPVPPAPTSSSLIPLPLRSLLSGLLSSTVGALIGAGGGILLTPLLTLSAVSQHAAHGTSLVVISFTALISALRYAHSAQLDLAAALALMASAIFATPAGARASSKLDAHHLRRCFGAFLVFVSVLIPLVPRVATMSGLSLSLGWRLPVLIGLGFVTGFLSGLLGIGGGTINVPALVLFAGFSQKVAQGTALMAMVLPSVRGAYAHLKLGQVCVDMLPGLVLGAVAGGFLGASTAIKLPENALRLVCSVVFAMMGLRYLFAGRTKS